MNRIIVIGRNRDLPRDWCGGHRHHGSLVNHHPHSSHPQQGRVRQPEQISLNQTPRRRVVPSNLASNHSGVTR